LNLGKRSDEAPLTENRRREYQSLRRAKGRRQTGQYLIEGVRALEAAVDGQAELVDIVTSQSLLSNTSVARLLSRATVRVLIASERDLDRMSDSVTPQGVLAAAMIPKVVGRPEVPCLILDGVQDPGNVGTLIRTAAWYGVRSVICGPGTADPYQPKAVRSSQGGLWDLDVLRIDDLGSVYDLAGREGIPVFVAHMNGGEASKWGPDAGAFLVIGSEAHGPSARSLKAASETVRLPRRRARGATESLNAAVAGGILLDRWLGATAHPSG